MYDFGVSVKLHNASSIELASVGLASVFMNESHHSRKLRILSHSSLCLSGSGSMSGCRLLGSWVELREEARAACSACWSRDSILVLSYQYLLPSSHP